jgi:crotonobetainyl-CoA:carnitine CoA-transferase CaiB-like acyl-CoA transferase
MTSKDDRVTGALAGLRVLELGSLIAGPFCGQLLGDMGAEVIKIEPPGAGDPMRGWGRKSASGESLWWPVIARNKKSITLDMRQPEGQALLRRLIPHADFLIENFRPGTMERWGCGWQELSAINPKLIMIRVSGYGQSGPYAARAGFGAIGEAMGGLRHIVGDPSTPPSRVGISIGDSLAATHACLGALAALHRRNESGRGQVVDCAIYEAVLAMMESLVTEYDKAGVVRERTGAILPKIAPSNVYPTRDGGFVLIAGNQDTVFGRMAQAMGHAGWVADPRFKGHTARGENQAELDELIAGWTRARGREEILGLMETAGVPAGLIYTAPDMLQDEQFRAREAIVEVPHPRLGSLRMQNVTPKLSETPGSIRTAAPTLGEHNVSVYAQYLGLDVAALAALRDRGIV